MDNEPLPSSKRGRLMGKLFGGARERKVSNPTTDNDGGLNDFFHGPSDKLEVEHSAPPGPPGPRVLAKLDTLSVSRYPNALNVNVKSSSQQSLPLRGAPSPRNRNRKGLVVRFVDTFPDVIGEGGDECEVPTVEIARRRPPPPLLRPRSPRRSENVPEKSPRSFPPDFAPQHLPHHQQQQQQSDGFNPSPLRRTQTGYSSVSEPPSTPPMARAVPAGKDTSTQYLDASVMSKDEKRKSFIELQQAQMRQAEGLAFARAVRSSSAGGGQDVEDGKQPTFPRLVESPDLKPWRPTGSPDSAEHRTRQQQQQPGPDQSPASTFSNASSLNQSFGSLKQYRRGQQDPQNGSPTSPQKASSLLHNAGSSPPTTTTTGDDALKDFASRTRHLFELFRLHSESVRPLFSCPPVDLARAALWWFLKGRMALETAVRERPASPQSQRSNDMLKQQSYADLAKGYWIMEEVFPEISKGGRPGAAGPDQECEDARRSLISNLRKLSESMRRNGFLPPPAEDAILPQTLDRNIWLEYPQVSQDIIALLWGAWGGSALVAPQRPMEVLESLPLGDTAECFSYGRVPADVFLMEQGMEKQRLFLPCVLSMVRPQKQSDLIFILASQNGAVQLRIQTSSKNGGPTFDHIRWQNNACALEMKLPRGFVLIIQLSQADYRLLWNMYDFGGKVQSTLYPRKDENEVFRKTLWAFQYFDSDPKSRQFPKEVVHGCELAVFERVSREGAATGPRHFHRGFRVAVITGPGTRTLSGVNHAFVPAMPVQYSFLRGEQDRPSLLLRFESSRAKGTMVMSFGNDQERLELHSLLLGTMLQKDDAICSQVPLLGVTISQKLGDLDGIQAFKKLPWTRAKVINGDDGSEQQQQQPGTVLSDRLRVVLDFKNGSVTDRVNVAPGELKIRLDVDSRDANRLSVLRLPQQDLTVAVHESLWPKGFSKTLEEPLALVQAAQTVRTYSFTSRRDLHDFEAALTGFKVLFDGTASAFAISRRRMVVPIHKKWEAGATRIQVVRQDKVTQLLAFFDNENFHHGHCMGFVLKGTDVFEAVGGGRSGKYGIKFDDAKFPLPRVAAEGEAPSDDMAFVCLDMPELPGEHDDITILFESEKDRDQLITCLPAAVRNSRLASLKF